MRLGNDDARMTSGFPYYIAAITTAARPALRLVCPHDSRLPARHVIQRARSRLGEHSYQLMSNNCEHFCEWCIQGESRSRQVETLQSRPRRLIAVGFALGLQLHRWLSSELGRDDWAI